MAALFTAASTQYLTNSSPGIVDYPFTVGMWINLTAIGTVRRTLFALSDTGTTNNYLLLRMTATETIAIVGAAGGTENEAAITGAIIAGRWVFCLARFIASNNRRALIVTHTGVAETNNSTARAPTGMDTITIGALSTSGGISDPWGGMIGEYWLLNSDVQGNNAANVESGLGMQLAYGGPFSVPSLAAKVLEYRSLRKAAASDADEAEEVFAINRQTWTNTNGVTIGAHPPLPYWYVKPGQTIRNLMV